MTPEEAGAAFQIGEGHSTYTGIINLDLIKRVNNFMSQLSEPVKQVMISKTDNYMVYFPHRRKQL